MDERHSPVDVRPLHKVALLQGLSVLSRLAILELLRQGPACVSEIVDHTGLSQPNVSNHLACLRDCGLVTANSQGRFVIYALADDDVHDLLAHIERVAQRTAPLIEACPRFAALFGPGK